MTARVVVVGGNAAGMTAASRAKRLDPSLSVTILEAGPRIAYSICGLPYAVSGRVEDLGDLVLFTPESLENERGIKALVNRRVAAILPSRRAVEVEDRLTGARGVIPYDSLLVATGYRPLLPGIEGANAEGVFTAGRLEDGGALLSWIEARKARRAVLLGGGYVGLEMAEALVERGLEVTVVERSRHVLGSLDPEMAALVEEELAAKGVRVLAGRLAERISTSSGRVDAVELGSGSLRIPADLVLVDVGVEPRVELATPAGIRLGPTGAIAVSEQLETSVPGVYAAGNCAECVHLVTGRPVSIPLGTVAAKQGRIAGENLAGRRSRFAGALGTSIVKLFGIAAASTGLNSSEAEREGYRTASATIRGKFQADYFGAGRPATVKVIAERGNGRLLGASIVGSTEGAARIDVLATAIAARMTVEEATQLDLAYAPPVAALWNPILVAMNVLAREL
jgi:NADPH-dependent 2,4-dienoyl-CoA reductase/sulfur reductase-like enzyme